MDDPNRLIPLPPRSPACARDHDGNTMTDAASRPVHAGVRGALNGALASKVPQVTVFFLGHQGSLHDRRRETASDFLNVNMGLGLTGTAVAAGVCLALILVVQFRAKKYVRGIYWLAVMLISVFGTCSTGAANGERTTANPSDGWTGAINST